MPEVGSASRLGRLINKGADIGGSAFGSAAGAVTGLLLGGPAGAALGGLVGGGAASAIQWVGHELSSRHFAPREEARVGYVYTLAAAEVVKRIGEGESVRSDGFFSDGQQSRSSAEEVWESVLLKAQREPEEKKLQYMAHLLANLAFHPEIGVHMAHQLTKTCEQLTYRQMCILRLSVNGSQFILREDDYRGRGSFTRELYQLLHEYLDLYNRGFVNFGGEVAFGPTDIRPRNTTIQGIGADIYKLLQLWEIPIEDIKPIAAQLR